MQELDHFVVANPGKIPCSVRTLRPYWNAGELKPWCHVGQLGDALEYLALRSGMDEQDISVLKEQHEKLYSLLKAAQDQVSDTAEAGSTNGH